MLLNLIKGGRFGSTALLFIMNAEYKEKEIARLKDVDTWPASTICMKHWDARSKQYDQHGLMQAAHPLTVLLIGPDATDEALHRATKITYNTVEEMVQDGWLAD